MQEPEDNEAFLDTMVLDVDIEGAAALYDFDGEDTAVLDEDVLRRIQQELD